MINQHRRPCRTLTLISTAKPFIDQLASTMKTFCLDGESEILDHDHQHEYEIDEGLKGDVTQLGFFAPGQSR
jgi:hypothetical protein